MARSDALTHGKHERSQAWLLYVWVALAMMLGGGGSPNPQSELILQLACAVLLGVWIWSAIGSGRGIGTPDRYLLIIAALIIGMPLLQLLPLPPFAWQALPGRETMREALTLVGEDNSWRPWSIAPHLTLAGLLAILPPIFLAWLVSVQGSTERVRLLIVISAVALCSVILGALQLAGSGEDFRLYGETHRGWLTGFHANRNAAADVLLIGALAGVAWWLARRDSKKRPPRALLGVFLTVLAVGVVVTGSRAGVALIAVVAAGVLLMTISAGSTRLKTAMILVAGMASVASIVMLALAHTNTRIAALVSRFTSEGEFRPDLWRDSWTAMEAFLPWGTGIGTFVPAFLPHERLEVIDATMPNRAHNEYLELAIEAGMPGLAILALVTLVILRLAWTSWRVSSQPRVVTLFALQSFIVIALHALVDYPLRNMAIASLAGVALGLLVPPQVAGRIGSQGSEPGQG